jgi:hypothetical protein
MEKLYGMDRAATLATIVALAVTLDNQGKKGEVEELFRTELERCEKLHGGYHAFTVKRRQRFATRIGNYRAGGRV